jgi:RLL motif-containing protein 1
MWYRKRLLALGYPGSGSFDISNIDHIQTLVAWLEDIKIRSYKIEERAPLRTMNDKWLNVFREYMKELGCPHPLKASITSDDWVVLVDWILAHAIGLMYADNVDATNEKAQKQLETKQTNKIPVDTSDYNSPQFKEALTELATLLKIPMHDDPAVLLNTIQKAVKSKFSKTALAEAKDTNTQQQQSNTVPGLHSDTSINEDKFPLGFNTGETKTNTAATMLRLLYIRDLRELQTSINDIIVAIQEFTANPRTNTVLGKVGR